MTLAVPAAGRSCRSRKAADKQFSTASYRLVPLSGTERQVCYSGRDELAALFGRPAVPTAGSRKFFGYAVFLEDAEEALNCVHWPALSTTVHTKGTHPRFPLVLRDVEVCGRRLEQIDAVEVGRHPGAGQTIAQP
jgi:hypothetical protein